MTEQEMLTAFDRQQNLEVKIKSVMMWCHVSTHRPASSCILTIRPAACVGNGASLPFHTGLWGWKNSQPL